jgi:thiol-disulfide isomerase/thioredoxin
MKKIIRLLFILSLFSFNTFAKEGFSVKVKFSDYTDSMIYLCHYFGKSSTVFRDDSVRLSKKGEGIFSSDKKIVGGLYMFLTNDQKSVAEFIITNNDQIDIEMSKSKPIETMKFKGSAENTTFYEYQKFLTEYGKSYQKIEGQLVTQKNKADTSKIYEELKLKGKELTAYREKYMIKNPTFFLSKLFKAIWEPEVPTTLPTLADGTKDSTYPRNYYKGHYWDKYDFKDDRLIYSPIYERKLDDYMTKLVVPMPDSVNMECDALLKKAEGMPETYKYTLWYLTRWVENSKVMGMDESFVYLVENYYMKGKATWLEQKDLDKYIDRAKKIAPNMIGQPAMELRMQDSLGKIVPLSSVKADYTILIFWSPTCGHCKTEMPRFDSLYKSELKNKNIKIYAVDADNETEKWKTFIHDNKLNEGWIHVSDPQHITNFRAFYDVYSTPTVYLLDDKKIIRGKRIDEKNVVGLIEWLEKKKKKETKK